MQNKKIRGEYYFEITFQNMFIHEKILTKKYKNIITNNGVIFFLTSTYDENWNFYSISHGIGTNPPTKSDETLEEPTYHNTNIKFNVEGNKLTLNSEAYGYNINNTTEIGVYYITPTENKLVSRNVHPAILVPDNSYIIMQYEYIVSTAEYMNDWELVSETTNTYSMILNYPPNYIIETDTNNGYHKLDAPSDLDTTAGAYYYDSENEIIYIHCSDSEAPSQHKILINY